MIGERKGNEAELLSVLRDVPVEMTDGEIEPIVPYLHLVSHGYFLPIVTISRYESTKRSNVSDSIDRIADFIFYLTRCMHYSKGVNWHFKIRVWHFLHFVCQLAAIVVPQVLHF